MSDSRVATGRLGERLAAERLEAQGWRILTTNWRGLGGEIDIVAEEGGSLVLVEVRCRRSLRFGTAEESLGPSKRRRMARLAEQYVLDHGWTGPWRLDAVAIELDRSGRVRRLTHYRNAVEP
jgi:putative endonuclease